MSMFNAGPTRTAQPPGGRTSFSFNDGSDQRVQHSRPLGAAGAGYFDGHINRKPPGGASSFVFDDTISRGVGDEPQRHTNGLRRIQRPDVNEPTSYRQAPGGRSSFSLTDASYNNARSGDGDALDDLVRTNAREPAPYLPMAADRAPGPQNDAPRQPPPYSQAAPQFDAGGISGSRRQHLAPPGGQSSFSFGWGQDNANHHHAYLARRPVAGMGGNQNQFGTNFAMGRDQAMGSDPAQLPMAGHLSASSSRNTTPGFAAAFAAEKPSYSNYPQGGGGGGGGSGGGGGGHGHVADYTNAPRSSTYVAQPPGGASSFTFG